MYNTEALTGMTLNDRYSVLDKIGTGGMAIVYKAHDNVLDRDVAIKVLRENYEIESAVVSNFIKEARSSASLVHPNVVSVYDVCECDGLNYMVMELVDGITLKEYIKKNPRLPWQEACDYAIQIGQGIQAAHERNIIHRDIKPQNIIVDSTGTLKVTDFGIAKAVEGDKAIAGGTAMGSVHYISPEQARGGFTDFRSDIYSMGIVLYEMLAGRVPFDGDTPVAVAIMHIEEEALDVKCVNMDVPADLAYVTMKAMSREQGKRYQKMQDFLDDLRAVLADEILPSKEQERLLAAEQYAENDFDVEGEDGDFVYSNDRDTRVRQKTKEKVMKKKSERKALALALTTTIAVALIILGVVIIFLNISSKSVPDLTGVTLEEATKIANRYGYKISSEVEYSFSDDVEKDMVISQFPEAGEEAPKHEDIKIVLSLGSTGGSIRVPNLVNSRVDDAIAEIDNLKLIYNIVYDESNDVEMGNVIRQTPLAGTHINEGDVVTIHISSGVALDESKIKDVKVPAVQMQTLDAGRAIITANGLTVGTITYEQSETVAEGSIIEQNPSAGTTVKRGSVVTLVVSGGGENEEETEAPEETLSPSETEKPQLSGNVERYTVRIPDDAGETVHVKIVANGNVMHDSTHKKSEGVVVCEIVGNGTVRIQTYIDGICVNDEKKTL